MPNYNLTIEDREYEVQLLKKRESLFEARVNGRPMQLELEKPKLGAKTSLVLKVAGKTYQVELENISRIKPFTLKVNDIPFQAKMRESLKKKSLESFATPVPVKTKKGKTSSVKEGVIVAPMAGKIISVKVKNGEVVKDGDVICILEAMKMENEILATKTGKITKVEVSKGSPVNEGDIIVVIE
jgi:biotin carboxyl carrier protein